MRLEASFDDYVIQTDQPVRYKGDGTAPSPFDYFLASSALCAAYFVKIYCAARDIPTEDIKVYQQNTLNPENRYDQDFHIQIELPDFISEKDKQGILAAMDRCTVKRVIQNSPKFIIESKKVLEAQKNSIFDEFLNKETETLILGKDAPLEETIEKMTALLDEIGIKVEIASWRNPIPHVWSVHVRDADSPLCYTNGKGATKEAALCSALGEYFERISNNYFYNDYYLGEEVANAPFVHYPDEKWFTTKEGLMDDYLWKIYNPEDELELSHLVDTNSGQIERGVCAVPFIKQSNKEKIYIPVNLIGNLFVSNGMSAGNTKHEARVQALSEIFERAVKNQIIKEEIALPDIPKETLAKYPKVVEGIQKLEELGFPVYCKDASLGGRYPVISVTLMNPKNGGVFASFGAHPNFGVALERTLTELLQGRSFEGLNDTFPPTFNSFSVSEPNNIIDHFIDSTGVISWKFFSEKADYDFTHWDFTGTTEEEFNYLIGILDNLELETYIADYNDLGVNACRILVPNYSEIYPVDDLIWDNHNRSLDFRERILNLHNLESTQLSQLNEDLFESELDDYMPITELIGIAFEETTPWGQLNIGELKGLIYLAQGELSQAKEYVEMFLNFNDNLPERKTFYQLLNAILDIELNEELKQENYKEALCRMYGEELYKNALHSTTGELKFFGLTPTSLKLEGVDKHQRLIESYKKLMIKRTQLS